MVVVHLRVCSDVVGWNRIGHHSAAKPVNALENGQRPACTQRFAGNCIGLEFSDVYTRGQTSAFMAWQGSSR